MHESRVIMTGFLFICCTLDSRPDLIISAFLGFYAFCRRTLLDYTKEFVHVEKGDSRPDAVW